jgi:4-hydroxybenzoate polyprenyltransferase
LLLDSSYLKLLRIPNIFTVPPDIILGFFIAQVWFQNVGLDLLSNSIQDLPLLVISSITLYLGGLISNDLFDIKSDRFERPNRPLASGKVQKKYAIILLILFFIVGFLLSLLVNLISAAISGLLILSILIYNYRLKSGHLRPIIMGGIRALNVFYGFSVSYIFLEQSVSGNSRFFLPLYDINTDQLTFLLLVLVSIFFHIFVLTRLSSKETAREFTKNGRTFVNFKTIYYIYISFLFIIGFCGFYLVVYPMVYLIFILALGVVVSSIFYKAHKKMIYLSGNLKVQNIVKNMLILLILLDSAFIAGISGPIAGFATCLLLFPTIILSKKISMT